MCSPVVVFEHLCKVYNQFLNLRVALIVSLRIPVPTVSTEQSVQDGRTLKNVMTQEKLSNLT
jgi:hypothetical protein